MRRTEEALASRRQRLRLAAVADIEAWPVVNDDAMSFTPCQTPAPGPATDGPPAE